MKKAVIWKGVTKLSTTQRDEINEMMERLDDILIKSPYFGGKHLTIADLSILNSIGVLYVNNNFLWKSSEIIKRVFSMLE